jgi:hypothetical protein
MMITRGMTIGIALAGAALGLAGPASAQLGEGSYTWTVTGGAMTGIHSPWGLTPCGQSCLNVQFSNGKTTDLHLQGNTWTGPMPDTGCIWTLDNNSLTGRNDCPGSPLIEFQLTNNG